MFLEGKKEGKRLSGYQSTLRKKKTENSSSIALSNSFSKSSWQVAWHQTCDRHLTSGTQWPGKESGKKKAEARGQEICSFTTTNTWHAGMLNLPHPTNLQHSATRVAYIIAFTKTCISFSSCLIQLSLFARDLAEGKYFEQLSYLIPSESWMGSLRHGSPRIASSLGSLPCCPIHDPRRSPGRPCIKKTSRNWVKAPSGSGLSSFRCIKLCFCLYSLQLLLETAPKVGEKSQVAGNQRIMLFFLKFNLLPRWLAVLCWKHTLKIWTCLRRSLHVIHFFL